MNRIAAICILVLAALPAQAQAQVDVTEYGDVVATGKWQALNKDDEMEKHAVHILCFKQERMCVEAKATLSIDGEPMVFLSAYGAITRWDREKVVAVDRAATCVTATLRINVREHTATLTVVPKPEAAGIRVCAAATHTAIYRLISLV